MCSLADPSALLGTITRSRVHRGEIVWVGDQFAVAQTDFDRKGKAEFLLLRDARQAKFMGEKAIPIVDIIDKVDLPDVMLEVPQADTSAGSTLEGDSWSSADGLRLSKEF